MDTHGTAAIVDNIEILVHDAGSGRLVDRQSTFRVYPLCCLRIGDKRRSHVGLRSCRR